MEDPDSTGQLPSPSIQGKASAQVLKLPLSLGHPHRSTNKHGLDRNELGKNGLGNEVRSKAKPNLWYALYLPQLDQLPESQQKTYLNQLAGLMQDVSSTVSFHPQALICEISSSLKYFSGIDNIHRKLSEAISEKLQQWQLPEQFSYAASPTISGSLLLARSGHNRLVYRQENLRSALGELSVEVLDLNKEQHRRLYNMGVRHLRDIWRLPSSSLRKRFGSHFVDLLNKALGKAPEPTHNYLPPPAFTTSYELPYELESLDRLLPIADELIAQLCDFLTQRDLSTSHMVFSLLHEKRSATEINLGLRIASRNNEQLMLLLETHFSKLLIPAPVIAVKLKVKKFDAFFGQSESLLVGGRPSGSNSGSSNALDQFMDQLQARLGSERLKNICSVAEHCPEYASQRQNYHQQNKTAMSKQVALNPRPLWLLAQPQQLRVNKGRLYHRSNISILSGPERIESRWWTGEDIRRDYYVAEESNGCRLWIYRERRGERNWYLHGLFS